MILFFDTETTGRFNWNASYDDPSQPDIVQLAAALVDDDFNIRHQISHIVSPDGWTIFDEVAQVHGITQAVAKKYGAHIVRVLESFAAMVDGATEIVAHNLDFDKMVMDTAFHRHQHGKNPFAGFMAAHGQSWFCTMRAMVPVCKLLPMRYGEYKFPKLQEAYLHATGKELVGAHDAMNDVRGCIAVYRYLKRLELLERMKAGEE